MDTDSKKRLTVKQRLFLMLLLALLATPLILLILFQPGHISFRQLGMVGFGNIVLVVGLMTFLTERILKRKS